MSTSAIEIYGTAVSKRLFGSQLRRNMAITVGLTALSASVMALSYRFYLHKLGYEVYGLWLVLSTVIAFSQVGNLGISQAVVKKVADHWPHGDLYEIKGYLTTASFIVCVSGLFIIATLTVWRGTIAQLLDLSPSNAKLLITFIPGVTVFSVYLFVVDISNSVLSGLGRLDLSSVCQSVAQVLSFTISAVLLQMGWGLEAMLIGSGAGYLMAHCLSVYLAARITGDILIDPTAVSLRHVRELLTFGGWIVGSALVNLLITPMNRAILVRFGGVALVPLYDIPLNSCMRIRSIVDNSQRALIAEVSSARKNTNLDSDARVRQLGVRAFKIMLTFGPIYGAIAVFAAPILKLWLGDKYTPEMTTSFQAISIGVFIGMLGVPSYYILLGIGRAAAIFTSNVVQALANIFAVALLILVSHSLTAVSLATAASIGMAVGGMALIWQERCTRISAAS